MLQVQGNYRKVGRWQEAGGSLNFLQRVQEICTVD